MCTELTGESMKKARVLAICLTVLLVSATSSFAAVIWTAPAGSTVYANYAFDNKAIWSSGTLNLLGVQGTDTAPLKLALTFTTSSFAKPPGLYVTGTLKGITNFMLDSGSASWTETIDVRYSDKGIYAFTAYVGSKKSDTTGTWTFGGATLSNSKPATTPIPAAGLLLGSGLLGLFGLGKARRRKD